METVTRYDFAPIRAKVTDEGYLVDSPIVSRVGVFEYRRADGSVRRELRRPEAVFDPLHLASLRGKPVTVGHPGYVNARNVRQHFVGTILSEGRRDGDHLTADLVIYDPDAVTKRGKRELSLGYSVQLNEQPGEWNGQHFDAEQVAMVVNHCAIVDKGRAGIARLNLDGADAEEVISASAEDSVPEPVETVEQATQPAPASPPAQPASPPPPPPPPPQRQDAPAPTTTTTKDRKMSETAPSAPPPAARLVLVRVDGIEYMTEPQIARELDSLRERIKEEAVRADRAEAERDAEKAAVTKHEASINQIKLDAAISARARMKLETEAARFGIEPRSDMSDRDMREAVVRKLRGDDVRFDGKSDDYVAAAFDREVEVAKKAVEQNGRNRQQVSGIFGLGGHVGPSQAAAGRADAAGNQPPAPPPPPQQSVVSAATARDRMIRNMISTR